MTDDLTVQTAQLPATRTGGTGLFKRVAKGNNLLPRLKLFSSGKWINKRLVKPGQYGVIVGDDEVTVYGDTIDMFVFAARAKALDRTNPKSTVANFEDDSDILRERLLIRLAPSQEIEETLRGVRLPTATLQIVAVGLRGQIERHCGDHRGVPERLQLHVTTTLGPLQLYDHEIRVTIDRE